MLEFLTLEVRIKIEAVLVFIGARSFAIYKINFKILLLTDIVVALCLLKLFLFFDFQ